MSDEFTANSHLGGWFGLRIRWAFWNHDPITTVLAFAGGLRGVTIVANTPEGTVIFLQSHPVWAAAQRRDRERSAAMRRHPSYRARQRAAASGSAVIPLIRNFKAYSSGTGTTPA
ncbi:hypothetical protein [Mycobacterium sp.]|jgi:hypothetical protein